MTRIVRLRAQAIFSWEYEADLDSAGYKGLTAEEAAKADTEGLEGQPDLLFDISGTEPDISITVVDS